MYQFGKLFLINVLPSLPLETDMDRFIVAQFVIDNAAEIASRKEIAEQVLQNLFTAQGAYNHIIKEGETAPDFNLDIDMRKLLSCAEDTLHREYMRANHTPISLYDFQKPQSSET